MSTSSIDRLIVEALRVVGKGAVNESEEANTPNEDSQFDFVGRVNWRNTNP